MISTHIHGTYIDVAASDAGGSFARPQAVSTCAMCGRVICAHTDAQWQRSTEERAVDDAISDALRSGAIRGIRRAVRVMLVRAVPHPKPSPERPQSSDELARLSEGRDAPSWTAEARSYASASHHSVPERLASWSDRLPSSTPVVVGANTVAKAGGATSTPGKGVA